MAPRYDFIPRCFDLLSIKLWSAKPAFDQTAFSNYAVTILFHLAFLSFKNLVTVEGSLLTGSCGERRVGGIRNQTTFYYVRCEVWCRTRRQLHSWLQLHVVVFVFDDLPCTSTWMHVAPLADPGHSTYTIVPHRRTLRCTRIHSYHTLHHNNVLSTYLTPPAITQPRPNLIMQDYYNIKWNAKGKTVETGRISWLLKRFVEPMQQNTQTR